MLTKAAATHIEHPLRLICVIRIAFDGDPSMSLGRSEASGQMKEQTITRLNPAHPGEVVADALADLRITKADAAKALEDAGVDLWASHRLQDRGRALGTS